MSMTKLAEHVLAVANEKGKKLTNLQLQKVMFFSLGLYIRKKKCIDQLAEEIYSEEPFSKWKYGPVVEKIYYNYNHYGSREIEEEGILHPEYNELNQIIENLIDIDVFQLVDLSHKLDSWKKHAREIINRNYVAPYTLEEIAEDFLNA